MYIVHVMSKSAAQAIIRAKERGSTCTYTVYICYMYVLPVW